MANKVQRQCASCGTSGMIYGRHTIARQFEGSTLTIPEVEGWLCAACGELEFDSGQAAQRFFEQSAELQQMIRSKQAAELRAIRKKLKLTQRQAAELFGGGVNSFSDYERGVVRPARSTVLLLHLLNHHPELLQELRSQQQR